ncbi:UNVERIFIED_CONTAM: hypothetical protein FKN15_002133 [Acipenser sinensis]
MEAGNRRLDVATGVRAGRTSLSSEGATTNAKSITFEEAVAHFAQFCIADNKKHIQHLLDRPEVHPLMQHLSTRSETGDMRDINLEDDGAEEQEEFE